MRRCASIYLVLLLVNAGTLLAQDSAAVKVPKIFVGLRCQKAIGFYWTNGLSLEFSSPKLCKQKISLGYNFVSSLFGSGFASNAIQYMEMNFLVLKYFREGRSVKPLLRVNLGYARADLGLAFSGLPDRSFLASIEGGAAYDFKRPFRITLTGGYNVITGNGMKGLGVLFPIYAQCSVFYHIRVKQKWINLLR